MSLKENRKRSLYFPEIIINEMQDEAVRQDRSLSWIVQHAWRIARIEVMKLPSIDDPFEDQSLKQYNDFDSDI